MAKFDNKPFTNVDNEDYIGRYAGEDYPMKAGETQEFPEFLRQHFAKHLANKIQNRKVDAGIKEDEDFRKDEVAQSRVLAEGREDLIKDMLAEKPLEPTIPSEPKAEPEEEKPEEEEPKKVYRCLQCNFIAKTPAGLAAHMRHKHPKKKKK